MKRGQYKRQQRTDPRKAATGPASCYRVPVRGVCSVCDQWASQMHSPINRAGVYCAACCPACCPACNATSADKTGSSRAS